MFEIDADDIALLSDEQLRVVVARLCEAEVRARGQSASYVTWGGNQTAADGGIDVRVALPPSFATDGFVPRRVTGYQAKSQDMPANDIIEEMRPKGIVRPSIQALADLSGAYIIVSSRGSASDSALTSRRDAMKTAVAGIPNAHQLALDFYDRTRIATWVRSHEGLIPSVRTLIGKGIPGWQSYGPWAYAPSAVTTEYLLDDKLRVRSNKRDTDKGLSSIEGIQQLREELWQPRHVVRLVGLSGVGKTRIVQALFDDRIGQQSLNPSLAIYTNMADDPDPQPIGHASNLVAGGTRAILVIDNCPPDLHHRLSEVCRHPDSKVSLITVEYDIREDEPEGTEVFTLETSSPELIEKLVRQRYPAISQVDARTIAEFSGGNARIAIAIAATIGHNETLAGLTDDQLFQRLFLQRHAHDESLHLVAQACALVYSFQGEDVSNNEEAELWRLAKLIGKTPQELYRCVAELKRRDLVQQRNVWRAVMPHAIANRLAITALQNIPYTEINQQFIGQTSWRLMKSLSRRLGYLHASKEASGIVKQWLSAGGLLGNVAELNDLGRTMFENVAPAAPEDVLAALERTLGSGDEIPKECKPYCKLLRSIAYDAALFERCATLLVKIIITEDVEPRSHTTGLFVSLFHLILSGTHASIEQRTGVIASLLNSSSERERVLGVLALRGALESSNFLGVGQFEFGARFRDYGYWPRTKEDVHHWFVVVLALVDSFAGSNGPSASTVRGAFAEALRGLWLNAVVPDEIATICRTINQRRFWPEGWLAVRRIMDLDGRGFDEDRRAKVIAIEAELRPTGLVQKVRVVVFSTRSRGVDLDDFEDQSTDDFEARLTRTDALVQDLGKAVANDEPSLAVLLPEIVTSDGRLFSFGQGLLAGARTVEELWKRLVDGFATAPEDARRPLVLNGFLHQLSMTNPSLAATLLDMAVDDETLARWYPILQVGVTLEAPDVARLKRSLIVGRALASSYRYLVFGQATHPIPPADLRELVLGIARMPSGYDVALEILHMRLHSDRDRPERIAPELVDAGCALLQQFTFSGRNTREDYRLGDLAKSCLHGQRGGAVTKELCGRLKTAVAAYETSALYYDDLLVGMFTVQPIASLDGLCGGDEKALGEGIRVLRDVKSRKSPLAAVSDDNLTSWCDQDPQARYPAMAQAIMISERADDKTPLQWTSTARRFLERSPAPAVVLRQFTSQFTSAGGWRGSLAAILESNLALLDQLEAYPALREAARGEKRSLRQWVTEEQRRETAFDRETNERFE